jgi:hypothetical protein
MQQKHIVNQKILRNERKTTMRGKNGRKALGLLLAAVMLLSLLPATALAANIQAGTGTITPNIGRSDGTVVGFAGQEWWVIGDDTSGVYPQVGSVTLLR